MKQEHLEQVWKYQVSQHAFCQYVAKQAANTIATDAPKVDFGNEELNKNWEEVSLNNNLLKINYEIVRLASLYGRVFVGLIPIKKGDVSLPSLTIGLPVYSLKVGFEWKKLILLLDFIKYDQGTFFVTETWDMTNENAENKQFVRREIYDISGIKIPREKINLPKVEFGERSVVWNTIPYIEFGANPFNEADLAGVPRSFFRDFDDNLNILRTDTLVSKPLFVTNSMSVSMEWINKLKEVLLNPQATLVDYGGSGNGVLADNVVDVLQGKTIADSVIKKLNYIEKMIKKFGFVKTDSAANFGTKNVTSNELEGLNLDADDYIEVKANLLEKSWELFFKNIYLPFIKPEWKNVNVEVAGSTKYLKNKANVYVQNQAGVLTNPNDLNQKNEEI